MTVDPGDAEFQSKLDERSRKRARDELHELNDKDRELAVQSLRQWALDQKWLRTPTDFDFLLRFLRVRKFSQLLARETLENYWTCKTKSPERFRNMDPTDLTTLEILRTGAVMSPKVYDKDGRRPMILSLGKLDLDDLKRKWGLDKFFKAMHLVIEWLIRDENVQVNGMLFFIDDTGFSLGHSMAIWNKDSIKGFVQFLQNAMPGRLKGIHVYNQAPFFEVLLALFSPFMKQKMKDRLKFHGKSMVKVYPYVSQDILPQEYLPDDFKGKTAGTLASVIEEMIADMQTPDFCSYIKTLSSEKYGVDIKAKDKDEQVASFRKLNVD